MKKCLMLGIGLAGLLAHAAVVTNSETLVISTATVFSGVTNIYTHATEPANINANLTLENKSYLRFWGASPSGVSSGPSSAKPQMNVGTTSEDVTLTIKGDSLFAANYRNSDGPSKWKAVGVDSGKDHATSRIHMNLGVKDGEAASTGRVKIDIQNAGRPDFGSNVFGGFWAYYLFIHSSVTPNESGYIDFLTINGGNSTRADIVEIDNLNPVPARILFNGGELFRNNSGAGSATAPLGVSAGHELILESVNGNPIKYAKQYAACNFTARKGGTVRFKGKDIYLRNGGNTIGDNAFLAWRLNVDDNVVWEHTGDLYFTGSCYFILQSDNVLPHGAAHGQIRLKGDTSNDGKAGYVNYSSLDVGATIQHMNGLVSEDQQDWRLGVVTNVAFCKGESTARGKVIFGEHDFSTVCNARFTAGVDVEKIGKGNLAVRHAFGEKLAIKEGSVTFSEGSAFDILTVGSGVEAQGVVRVSVRAVFAADADMSKLELNLDEGAKISIEEGTLLLKSLTINGVKMSESEYADSDWMESAASAKVALVDNISTTSEVKWIGAGADNLVTTPENWESVARFDAPMTMANFAQSGEAAVFPATFSYLGGLIFSAAGDFTLSGGEGAKALVLYGGLALDGEVAGTRTYTVDMPVQLRGEEKTITMPDSDVTVHLRDLSGECDIDIAGTKLSEHPYDYSTSGAIILENARTDGNIDHSRGGGTVIFRGELGVPGDSGTYSLDYGRFRNGEATGGGGLGWCEMGKTRMEDVTCHKKLSLTGGGGQTGATGTKTFLAFCGATNRLKALVSGIKATTVCGEKGAVTIFEKGVHHADAAMGFTGNSIVGNTPTADDPAIFIFDGPIEAKATSRALSFSGKYPKAIFRTQGNYSKLFLQLGGTGPKVEFTVDDAFDSTGIYFSNEATVDLCGTHQKFRHLMTHTSSEGVTSNVGTFTSEEPATLEVTHGAPNREACIFSSGKAFPQANVATNSAQQFTGPVSLVKSGTGYLQMTRTKNPIESTGSFTVNEGTVEFIEGTAWPNASAVTVTGTGALVLGKGDIFGKKTPLHLSGEGTLTLADGTDEESGAAVKSVMRVEELYLDGALAKPGVYGAIGDEGADYPTSHILSGRVRVLNLGTRIFLR